MTVKRYSFIQAVRFLDPILQRINNRCLPPSNLDSPHPNTVK
jgi:hypothetical protein